jgi:hypothetical protein
VLACRARPARPEGGGRDAAQAALAHA